MTNKISLTAICLLFLGLGAQAQRARIEDCPCAQIKVDPQVLSLLPAQTRQFFLSPPSLPDSSFTTKCGYLIVPENRRKKTAKLIKLPFIITRSKNPNKKADPVLFTGGGPGGSSLASAVWLSKSPYIQDRDIIVLEQRGTRFALPSLRSMELDNAIKQAYRKGLSVDSMTLVGVKNYKSALEKRGIDLSGYNTDESVSDIHDLIAQLKLDSVNLLGISYSGGLMTAVLQKDPLRIRSLILDSPLPTFVPIDEDEPANFMEALDVYFAHVKTDSVDQKLYSDLKQRFDSYFRSIAGKKFTLPFLEKGTKDSIQLSYGTNELLHIVLSRLFDDQNRKTLAQLILELTSGKHTAHMTGYFNSLFGRNSAPDGMRMAVYCADQAAYNSPQVISQLGALYPYLQGFRINDVYQQMCDCLNVPPIKARTKQPYYSSVPVLLADGEMDPACRPLYIDRIAHYMPNSQRFLLINKGHGVLGASMAGIIRSFLSDPFKKITSTDPNIISY